MRTYRELFAVREFTVMFALRCTVLLSVSMTSLAIGTITYDSTGSTVLTALAMFGGPLVSLIGSALVLGLSDTLKPRTALQAQIMAMTVTAALQAIPGLPWQARFAILVIPYVVASGTSGSNMRLLAAVVPKEGFLLGRSTLNIAVGLMQVLGYATGGLLLQHLTPSDLFLVSAVAGLVSILFCQLGIGDHPAGGGSGRLVRRTRSVNRALLTSPVLRPVYVALWVPNGLVVGCEALFVPYGGTRAAGFLFAAAAAGMLLGDVVVGRFVPPAVRDRLLTPLRLLLAAPYLGFALHPPLVVAPVLAFVASGGYSASLVLQERVHQRAEPTMQGQAFGLAGNGMMIGQAAGALLGGAVAVVLAPWTAMALLGAGSLAVTLALTAGLRRSAPQPAPV
jgi:predicted MFS family arabinose efflux permease